MVLAILFARHGRDRVRVRVSKPRQKALLLVLVLFAGVFVQFHFLKGWILFHGGLVEGGAV